MKLFLPEFYEDELFFSWISRIEVRNMFLCYTHTAKYMFGNPKTKVRMEFMNALTEDFVQEISTIKSIPDIIENHTMLPYYSRFWNKERKRKAYDTLYYMKSQGDNILTIPPAKGENKKMCYCPVCVRRERRTLGEAYWHRAHQIDGVNVCHKHKCKLIESDVVITTRKKCELVSAELNIPDEVPKTERGSDKEILLAKYLYELLSSPIYFEECDISGFLHNKLSGTKYTSKTARFLRASILYDDYLQYWENDVAIRNERAMKELCSGNRVNPYTIAQVAIMLEISAEDLLKLEVADIPAWKQFDMEVAKLNVTGIGYLDIGRKLNSSPNTIKASLKRQGIEKNRIKREYRPRKKAVV